MVRASIGLQNNHGRFEILALQRVDELGGVELGIEGGCGVVGLLALGQPVSSRQSVAVAAKKASLSPPVAISTVGLLGKIIGMDDFLGVHGLEVLKSWSKAGRAQFTH